LRRNFEAGQRSSGMCRRGVGQLLEEVIIRSHLTRVEADRGAHTPARVRSSRAGPGGVLHTWGSFPGIPVPTRQRLAHPPREHATLPLPHPEGNVTTERDNSMGRLQRVRDYQAVCKPTHAPWEGGHNKRHGQQRDQSVQPPAASAVWYPTWRVHPCAYHRIQRKAGSQQPALRAAVLLPL
jgi:hypothetical protein